MSNAFTQVKSRDLFTCVVVSDDLFTFYYHWCCLCRRQHQHQPYCCHRHSFDCYCAIANHQKWKSCKVDNPGNPISKIKKEIRFHSNDTVSVRTVQMIAKNKSFESLWSTQQNAYKYRYVFLRVADFQFHFIEHPCMCTWFAHECFFITLAEIIPYSSILLLLFIQLPFFLHWCRIQTQ